MLRLGGLVLGLALKVLLLAGLLPRLGTSKVADRLDGGTLQGVVLAGGLATSQHISIWTRHEANDGTYLGPLVLMVLSVEPVMIDCGDGGDSEEASTAPYIAPIVAKRTVSRAIWQSVMDGLGFKAVLLCFPFR